ncbi:unnamed protein product [Chilo suppressalis]|uniref:Uncharacterized protein n=1 Tax=Chilo suppressalis TaxID=168631 RepID=A0ABN8LC08_CHISP|nr:unnamed protein product [Chilo suppressalis]
MLSETADKLFATETAVRDMWCESEDFDEAVFETDQYKSLEYRQRWLNLQNRYRKLVKPSISDDGSTVKSVHEGYEGTSKRRINIPKLDLVKFDGNVKNWLLFWGQFKKIHEDADLDDIDKFQFLMQSTTVNSSARQLVETYPPSGENYYKAIEALKARFARDDVLIETYVRGLLNLVLMRQKGQTSDLTSLYDNLQTHLQALETLGVAKDKYASVLFPMIESALLWKTF